MWPRGLYQEDKVHNVEELVESNLQSVHLDSDDVEYVG